MFCIPTTVSLCFRGRRACGLSLLTVCSLLEMQVRSGIGFIDLMLNVPK
jgi:hypothetical protein